MDHIERLESQNIYIFREAFNRFERLAMLWSMGKDSNVMIWLARDGKRYRSLGDEDITLPVASGRAMDHAAEDAFERLRVDGYM